MTTRHKILLAACVLLIAATSTALVNNRRLQRHQTRLEAELAALRPLAEALARKPAEHRPPAEPPRVTVVITNKPVAAPDLDAERRALQAEIQTLRAQLNDRPNTDWTTRTNAPGDGGRGFGGRRGRWGEEEMEALKTSNPPRYQEIVTQRAEFRERIKSDTQTKQSFLSSLDVSQWPANLQENHAKIVAMYTKMAELVAQPADGAAPDRDAQHAMFSQWRETGELLQAEQDMLLLDTARQLGFDGANADQFVDYIKTIHDATSPRGFFPGRGPSPGGGGGNGAGGAAPGGNRGN